MLTSKLRNFAAISRKSHTLLMQQRPRPADSPLLDQPSVRFVVGVGSMKAVLALAVLGVLPTLGYNLEVTRTVAFHFMAVGQLFLTYPSRHPWMHPLSNPYLHAAVVGGWAFRSPRRRCRLFSNLLGSALPVELWTVVFVAAFGSWGLAELMSRLVWRQNGAGVHRGLRGETAIAGAE